MSTTTPQQCPCGKSIWWHYVRRTKAGVNAYCNIGPRVAVSRRLPPHRSASLEESARDVWDRLHRFHPEDVGVQERLL